MFDRIKQGYDNIKKLVKKAVKAVKFFLTPIGQFIGILILVVFLIIVIYVISKTIEHLGKMIWIDDYAGIATTGDYETVIGSIGYAGYDSLITEEKAQEYGAFEYAVLMDVAEHLYENQDYVTKITDPVSGLTYETSAVFPEGVTSASYNADLITKEQWQENLANAQDGKPLDVGEITAGEKNYNVGGNRKVVTPRLIYEIANHEYEEDTVSLIPYVVVVREDIKLNYYLKGLSAERWAGYNNLQKMESGDLAAASSNIEPVRFSAELNRYNINMPNSAYKEDLEKDQKGKNVIGIEDKEGFIEADRDNTGYGSDIYYTEDETDVVYKIPLKLLIGRYLPKSTLLTTWYMLKDEETYDLEGLMSAIKGVYNAACYNDGLNKIKPVTITGKIDEYGEVQPINKKVVLRTENDVLNQTANITNAIQFENGKILRDESGDAITGEKELKYSSTNKRTFIYFEQYGLETSRYEEYKAYKESGKDELNPNPISPAATYLTRDRVNFVEYMNLKLMVNVEKQYYDILTGEYKTRIEERPVNVKLKTNYSFLDEEDLDEKYKSAFILKSEPNINQENKPYDFMEEVVKRAEEKIIQETSGNKRVVKYVENTDEEEIIYDHFLINNLYIRAELGNENLKGLYRLPEDFRYYNQDDAMPHWYDLLELDQSILEKSYLEAFKEVYSDVKNYEKMLSMLINESEYGYSIVSYNPTIVNYSTQSSANLYDTNKKHINMEDARFGNYKINYYWDTLYTIEEKTLQMRQTVHHRRMPVLLVKYCDMWAKSIEYNNIVTQNPINYRNYKYLIPNSVSSLGYANMDLQETAKYRTETFKKFFNSSNNSGDEGIKEGDVLDMLVQWESYASKGGDETAYAFMRDLYKLVRYIRDFEDTMYKTAYSYLYIPSTISNFKDETVQKIFWLERLGVSGRDDELTETEQNKMRTKAIDTKWQNLEYDEYHECVYKVGENDENAKVYALFPYGAPIIRSYYMYKAWNALVTQDYDSGSHPALDMTSRCHAQNILAAKKSMSTASIEGQLYFYELNRLTLKYMQSGYEKEEAILVAEKTLDNTLKEYVLNSPVVAIAPGKVIAADYDSRSGFYVILQHDDKEREAQAQVTTLYAHLKRWPLVEVGETVGAGTILGYEGTTGRSTGNHLHFEIRVGGKKVNPKEYIMPVFSPFYYDIKAEAVLEKNSEMALGNEYYNLERTILTENALFDNNIVINGLKLSDGTIVKLNKISNRTKFYSSGEKYEEGSPYDVVWGNNIPSKELFENMGDLMDLNLLNQTIPFRSEDNDEGSDAADEIKFDSDVTADPVFFTYDEEDVVKKYKDSIINKSDTYKDGKHRRLDWPKWFAEEMAEYKSKKVVQCYMGPRNKYEEISSERSLNDLKEIQESLKKAGYFGKAGVDFEICYGRYSEEFEKVIKVMKKDLVDFGYNIYGISADNGDLDENTVAAYNTMVQYTTEVNQFTMTQKTAYNAAVNLSIEPALEWAILCVEGGYGDRYLALKEKENNQVLINLELGLVKENMMYFNEKYSGDIAKAKNKVLLGLSPSKYWNDVYEDSKKYESRWVDGENIDRIMLYAIALEAYDKGSTELELSEVQSILNFGPAEYSQKVLENFENYILKTK